MLTVDIIFKDSYVNPLTQLMSQHYYQTTFYDIRYNQDRTVYEYIEKHDFDTVAILYNNGTLFSTMYDFDLSEKKEREEQENKIKRKKR